MQYLRAHLVACINLHKHVETDMHGTPTQLKLYVRLHAVGGREQTNKQTRLRPLHAEANAEQMDGAKKCGS